MFSFVFRCENFISRANVVPIGHVRSRKMERDVRQIEELPIAKEGVRILRRKHHIPGLPFGLLTIFEAGNLVIYGGHILDMLGAKWFTARHEVYVETSCLAANELEPSLTNNTPYGFPCNLRWFLLQNILHVNIRTLMGLRL